jgi:hypothetical protein
MPTGRRSNAPSKKPHTNKNIKISFRSHYNSGKHFIYKGAAAIATLNNNLFPWSRQKEKEKFAQSKIMSSKYF